MSQSSEGNTAPKSMRHKQILDVAAENPEASIAELAAEVPSATTDLVKRVLEEHGDPAETDSEPTTSAEPTATDDEDGTGTDDEYVAKGNDDPPESNSYPAPEDLSPAERETIRAIREYPTASQRDLAEKLGVTASTISNRVNGIDGFDWADREAFANAVFSDEETLVGESGSADPTSPSDTETRAAGPESTASTDADTAVATEGAAAPVIPADEVDDTITTFQSTVEDLSAQLDDLEGQVETVADGGATPQPFADPELVHKVVHACMDSENITEEEELRILESLV